jgi:putative endonuclease
LEFRLIRVKIFLIICFYLIKTYRQQIGKQGEELAEKFLLQSGYKIVAKNYRAPYGEIDIIAQDEETNLVFIEVKTRTSRKYGVAQDAVNHNKSTRIKALARKYLQENFKWEELCWRIDIVEIYLDGDRVFINHLKNIN